MTPNLSAKSIEKNKPLKKAMDYNFLRSKGIEFITELSGRLWTDHNSHDPGITFMEMICYALTDLSYRTNFPVRDLIALSDEEEDAWNSKYIAPNPKADYNHLEKLGLFEAHEVLPTHPLTINDYRKLLLKIEGIRNAWLTPNCGAAETKIFANCKKSELTFFSFEYEFKTGVYNGESILFKFPKAYKYFKLRETLRVVNIKNMKLKGRQLTCDLSLKLPSSSGIITESAEFIFRNRKRNINKSALLSLFKTNGIETFWQELWEHYKGLLQNDIKEIQLNGLYNVRLELEIDPEMGPLTERKLYYKIPFGKLKGASVLFELNSHNLPKFPKLTAIQAVGPVTLISDDENIWQVNLELKINGKLYHIPKAKLHLLRDIPLSFSSTTPNQKKTIIIQSLGNQVTNPDNSIISTYWRKQTIINNILRKTCCVLDAHRNLCEDFLKVDLIDPQHVAICMDIETKNNTDLELLSAKINLAIEQYFNPPIKYYTLKELLEEGLRADEIFDGPYVDFDFKCPIDPDNPVFTKAGFIKTDELENSELKTTLYTSDIINILMDFDEIISVKNVLLRNIDAFGEPMGKSEKWRLNIPDGKQPVFNALLSKVIFFKDDIPYTAKKTETEQTLKYLRAKSKKRAYVPIDQSFNIEKGSFRAIDQFFALQNDLPDIYGTSMMKLPSTVSTERLNNTKNLKAYLLFFEQIFADYLQQLYNAKWLLSPEKIEQSYFSKYIKTEDICPLSEATFEEEYYYSKSNADPPYLEDNKTRQLLYERDQEFLNRRNAMLDHLLARFAESFADYTLMLYSIKGERVSAGLELINDKTNFLETYPKVSRERGKAFNYRPRNPAQLWDTDNISGLERRFGLLMGIQNIKRRFLHCDKVLDTMFKVQKLSGQNKFFIVCKNHENKTLFQSKELFNSKPLASTHLAKIKDGLRNESSYSFSTDSRLLYSYKGLKIHSKKVFDTKEDFEEIVENILNAYDIILQDETVCSSEANEGMFVIEHILLRPLSQDLNKTLLDVCLSEDCDTCGSEDPYSFRISVVMPYWPGRFNNPDFRRHFEKTLRMEIPSHIMPKICWINNSQMKRFGDLYKMWLQLRSQKEINIEKHNTVLAKLIAILKGFRNVYPYATLHDCEEDGGDNPVQLGHTRLGSF